LRTLTPERFSLEGETPTITVLACYAKNGKEAIQPITRELAARLQPLLDGKPPGKPVLAVPMRTAKMLRRDLVAAGISPVDAEGREVDFHALRGSYITHLIMDGVNPKIVQMLARHSTITLTLDRYTHVDKTDLRKALEGEDS
jgi:integrase/recombinase XerD